MAKRFTRQYDKVATKDMSGFNESQLKFINMLMLDGKKSVARKVFEEVKKVVEEKKLEKDFNVFFDQAIYNASPIMEVRSKRIAGSSYQVPYEVKDHRRRALAMRWLLAVARKKKGADMKTRLANELMAAYKNEGDAVKKKEEMHKMAEANRAFAHYAKY